jgi:hypothetical protein
MKPIVTKTGLASILCATGLAISIAIPAITSTHLVKPTPTNNKPTVTPANTRPTPTPKVTPATRVNSTPKVTPSSKVTPAPIPIASPMLGNNAPLVAVPSLTPQILKSFTDLYGQLIEVKLTPNQQRKIGNRLNRDWMTNLGLRSNVMQTLAMEPKILKGTPTERAQLQARLIGNLRQQVLDGDTDSLWLVSFFDASAKNWLAQGEPPLTRMTTDMSADALCFMVNEVMGKPVASPDSRLKNSIATKLTTEYAKIPPNIKQELSKLPANWLKFKDGEWLRRGEDFREQMRVHWGQNLEAYIPEVRAMSKLRADRLAKLKADPTAPWDKMNSLQRQAALQKPDLEFQTGTRTVAQVKTVQLNNYIDRMQLANAIGNSPTRYSLRLKVK